MVLEYLMTVLEYSPNEIESYGFRISHDCIISSTRRFACILLRYYKKN
jgi:hypothetical protein